MMKKINSKLIIELIIIATLVLALTTVAFAADPIIVGNPSNTQNETSYTNTQNEIPNVINSNTAYNTSNTSYRANTNNTTLPKTGVSSTVLGLIAVAGASAGISYKKYRKIK